MKMYLLLRNNKQSGPHSLDELKSMGLKAYDLVWLEGKSAAWRYPSEIEELSSFAPVVEEQPFDRFYKKASPAITDAGGENDNSRNLSLRKTNELPVVLESQRSSPLPNPMSPPLSPGKRIIYVTMPAGKSPASRQTDMREDPREATTSRDLPRESTVREMPVREPVFRELHPETPPPGEPVEREMKASYARTAIEDYAAPPSGARTTHAEYSLRSQSRGPALKTKAVTRFVAIGLCILALLAAGIFIGLSLNKDSLGLPHKMMANASQDNSRQDNSRQDNSRQDNSRQDNSRQDNSRQDNSRQDNSRPENSRNENAAKAEQPIFHPTAQQMPVPAVTGPSVSTHEGYNPVYSAAVPAKTVKATQSSTKTKERSTHAGVQYTTAPAQKDSATATIPSMQRETVHRSDNAETNRTSPATVDKEALRTAVANQISVGANRYSVGTFGGISDLQVTVTNRSAYTLDLVVVEVQYVQANKKVFRTENLYFRGIGAGSALMLEAPKSSRGIKVQTKLTTINSRELGLPGL